MNSHLFSPILSVLLVLGSFAGAARGEVQIQAEVVSSTASSSTVRFTFSGDLADLTPAINLQSFIFIDFTDSVPLGNSLANNNLTAFTANTVGTSRNGAITTMEIRNNETGYFDRFGFVFTTDFIAGDSFKPNSVLELVIPTSTPITTADFNNLNVYWAFPNWGTNFGRGTLAGIVNPVAVTPSISISKNASGQVVVEFTGVLESSPDLDTLFSPVPGATSPYIVPAGSPWKLFFRAHD